MPMTVRRLAATTSLGLTIVAGHDDVDLSISWAHAIELQDPTRWLAGGELVMTTGLHLPRSATKQYEYVERIAQTGAVALAFDTGTVHERVPDAIIKAYDELGFAVLSVAKETPFIAISRAVIDELTADQIRTVQAVVDAQEKLARALLDGVLSSDHCPGSSRSRSSLCSRSGRRGAGSDGRCEFVSARTHQGAIR